MRFQPTEFPPAGVDSENSMLYLLLVVLLALCIAWLFYSVVT